MIPVQKNQVFISPWRLPSLFPLGLFRNSKLQTRTTPPPPKNRHEYVLSKYISREQSRTGAVGERGMLNSWRGLEKEVGGGRGGGVDWYYDTCQLSGPVISVGGENRGEGRGGGGGFSTCSVSGSRIPVLEKLSRTPRTNPEGCLTHLIQPWNWCRRNSRWEFFRDAIARCWKVLARSPSFGSMTGHRWLGGGDQGSIFWADSRRISSPREE